MHKVQASSGEAPCSKPQMYKLARAKSALQQASPPMPSDALCTPGGAGPPLVNSHCYPWPGPVELGGQGSWQRASVALGSAPGQIAIPREPAGSVRVRAGCGSPGAVLVCLAGGAAAASDRPATAAAVGAEVAAAGVAQPGAAKACEAATRPAVGT